MFTYLPSPSCRSLPMPSQCRITNRIRTADSYILNIHNLGMHHKAWLLTFLRKQNQNKICRMHSQTRQPVYPVSMSHWIIQVKTNPVSVGFGPLCCCLCPSPTVYHQSVPSFCTSGSHRCVPSNPTVYCSHGPGTGNGTGTQKVTFVITYIFVLGTDQSHWVPVLPCTSSMCNPNTDFNSDLETGR